jgi:hypothetical protein
MSLLSAGSISLDSTFNETKKILSKQTIRRNQSDRQQEDGKKETYVLYREYKEERKVSLIGLCEVVQNKTTRVGLDQLFCQLYGCT